MWLANKSVTLFVPEINRSNGMTSIDPPPCALHLMISPSSRELYSCKWISNDQWWCCLSPNCKHRANHNQRRGWTSHSCDPLLFTWSNFFSNLENIYLDAVLCNRSVRHLQAGNFIVDRVLWGGFADMRFTLIFNDRSWTHLLGAAQTHSTANANIRYRPPKYTYCSVWWRY